TRPVLGDRVPGRFPGWSLRGRWGLCDDPPAGPLDRAWRAPGERDLAGGHHPDRHRRGTDLLVQPRGAPGRPAGGPLPDRRQHGRRLSRGAGSEADPRAAASPGSGDRDAAGRHQAAGAAVTWADAAAVVGGLVAGVLSGAVGIGGGLAFVPILAIGFRVSQTVAQGTSLAAIVPTALVGGITHLRQGNAVVDAAAWCGAAGGDRSDRRSVDRCPPAGRPPGPRVRGLLHIRRARDAETGARFHAGSSARRGASDLAVI